MFGVYIVESTSAFENWRDLRGGNENVAVGLGSISDGEFSGLEVRQSSLPAPSCCRMKSFSGGFLSSLATSFRLENDNGTRRKGFPRSALRTLCTNGAGMSVRRTIPLSSLRGRCSRQTWYDYTRTVDSGIYALGTMRCSEKRFIETLPNQVL